MSRVPTISCTNCGTTISPVTKRAGADDKRDGGMWRVPRSGKFWWEIAWTAGRDSKPYCVDCYEAIVIMEALRK